MKKSKLVDEFLKLNKSNLTVYVQKIEMLEIDEMPNLPPKISTDFDYYIKDNRIVSLSKDSIKFDGNIYLLVDNKVFSADESLVVF